MESEIYASFKIIGPHLDPEQVTRSIGISPSKTWRIGDLVVEQALLRHKNNGWLLKSNLPLSATLKEHVRFILAQLQVSWQALKELCTQHDAEISCVVMSYGGDRPAMFFDKDIISRAADLNAAIDIDLYVFPRRRKSTRLPDTKVSSTP